MLTHKKEKFFCAKKTKVERTPAAAFLSPRYVADRKQIVLPCVKTKDPAKQTTRLNAVYTSLSDQGMSSCVQPTKPRVLSEERKKVLDRSKSTKRDKPSGQ
jgi:hypothetical protein